MAKANTEKLINEQKVLALFGYVGTPTSNASLPIFTKEKVDLFLCPYKTFSNRTGEVL